MLTGTPGIVPSRAGSVGRQDAGQEAWPSLAGRPGSVS